MRAGDNCAKAGIDLCAKAGNRVREGGVLHKGEKEFFITDFTDSHGWRLMNPDEARR